MQFKVPGQTYCTYPGAILKGVGRGKSANMESRKEIKIMSELSWDLLGLSAGYGHCLGLEYMLVFLFPELKPCSPRLLHLCLLVKVCSQRAAFAIRSRSKRLI